MQLTPKYILLILFALIALMIFLEHGAYVLFTDFVVRVLWFTTFSVGVIFFQSIYQKTRIFKESIMIVNDKLNDTQTMTMFIIGIVFQMILAYFTENKSYFTFIDLGHYFIFSLFITILIFYGEFVKNLPRKSKS